MLKHLIRRTPVLSSLVSSLAAPTASTSAFTHFGGLRTRTGATGNTNKQHLTTMQGGYNSDPPGVGGYWNRETSKHGDVSGKIVKEARIVCLSDPDDKDNLPLYEGDLPEGSAILKIGATMSDFDIDALREAEPNVLFVSHAKSREPLPELLAALPSIEWVHARSAGIDFITSDGLSAASDDIILTNAKGCFSSTLAEYTLMACSYFAKDLPRLLKNKKAKDWDRYDVLELRGSTMGIVGYGDIGRACAKLADAYGMKVVALRRNPKKSMYDPYVAKVYGQEDLNQVMEQSDYIVVAAPLTDDTEGLVSADAISHAKSDAVLINVGRGPIIDEEAMIAALQDGTLKGAAMDVTTVEPLPKESALWELENVLLSPHNMDKTATFMKEATEFFVNENLQRFVRDKDLLNAVDAKIGY